MSDSFHPVPQRIGDAERDQAIEYLREHVAQGRLDQTEFDERLDAALAARTQTDLDPLFRDLPAPKPGYQQVPAAPKPAALAQRPEAGRPVVRSGRTGAEVALGTIAALAWPIAIVAMIAFSSWHGVWFLFILPFLLTGAFGRYRHDRRR